MSDRVPDPDPIQSLLVELTSACNLRCVMCPQTADAVRYGRTAVLLRSEHFEALLGVAAAADEVVVAGFGEPLLHPAALEWLHRLGAAGARVCLTTNGTKVTRHTARRLAALTTLARVTVSLDSTDPATYRRVRGGAPRRPIAAIEQLARVLAPEKLGVSAVLLEANRGGVAELTDHMARMGVRHVVLQQPIGYRDEISAPIAGAERAALSIEIADAVRRSGARLEVAWTGPAEDHPLRDGETRLCLLPWESTFVAADGVVFPCCVAAAQGAEPLGSLDEQPLADLWRSPAYRRFRARLLDPTSIPDVCRSCGAARAGAHPLARFGAELVPDACRLSGGLRRRIVARNVGLAPWLPTDQVRIGTAWPRDRPSRLWTQSWLSPNRAATFRESSVPPGALATFEFDVAPVRARRREWFQLVVDGQCWMPGTRVEVERPSPVRAAIRLTRHGVERVRVALRRKRAPQPGAFESIGALRS